MPSIFVSYRRTDAPGHAWRLYDRLVDRFGEASVFKDLDSMKPGEDFVVVIQETVARCDALLAVIGRYWLAAELAGRRRLDDPDDWVRLEIANALKQSIPVIPVLVDGASLPSATDLPQELRALTRRHASELHEKVWRASVDQLIDGLEQGFASASARAPSASRDATAEPRRGRGGRAGDQPPRTPRFTELLARRKAEKVRRKAEQQAREDAEELLDIVRSRQGITLSEFADALGCSQGDALEVLSGLRREGLVDRRGPGWYMN